MAANGLDAFFKASHVAVVGASATPGKLGHSVVRNLVKGGFQGQISAINPGGATVEGQSSYSSISAAPSPVDCAFLAIPSSRVLDAVRECASAKVRSIVIGASGFAELGTDEGRQLQAEIARIAAVAGMRIIGPNTNGLLDNLQRLSLGYNASHAESFRPGAISVLSHSGALFDGIAKRIQGYGGGLSKFVAVGNELDVSMLDLLEYLVDDSTTRVVGLVIEGLEDGPRLRRLAGRLTDAGKRVVALKIGRSEEGAGASLAHSSRMAGNSRAWDAMINACGFASVRTVEALAGTCTVLEQPSDSAGDRRLLCITTSGAGGAMLADFASDRNLVIAPQWSKAAAEVINQLPTSAAIRHPIDMGSLGDWSLLAPTLAAIETEGFQGPTVVYAHVAPGPGMARQLFAALQGRKKRVPQPLVVLAPGGLGADVEKEYLDAGIPVFHDTVNCFDTLTAVLSPCAWSQPQSGRSLPALAATEVAEWLSLAHPGQAMSEMESAAILRRAGIPMVLSKTIDTVEQCISEADRLGYPVVLKAMVPGVAHKFAAGLVGVGIADASQLQAEFHRQLARAKSLSGGASTYWLLQPMLGGRLELIAGVSHEPGLGHFLVYGLGGVYAEVFDQVDLVPIPISAAHLKANVEGSRIFKLLNAVAPSGGATQDLIASLLSLQDLVMANSDCIESIDVNPLLLVEDRLVAVDALVVPAIH